MIAKKVVLSGVIVPSFMLQLSFANILVVNSTDVNLINKIDSQGYFALPNEYQEIEINGNITFSNTIKLYSGQHLYGKNSNQSDILNLDAIDVSDQYNVANEKTEIFNLRFESPLLINPDDSNNSMIESLDVHDVGMTKIWVNPSYQHTLAFGSLNIYNSSFNGGSQIGDVVSLQNSSIITSFHDNVVNGEIQIVGSGDYDQNISSNVDFYNNSIQQNTPVIIDGLVDISGDTNTRLNIIGNTFTITDLGICSPTGENGTYCSLLSINGTDTSTPTQEYVVIDNNYFILKPNPLTLIRDFYAIDFNPLDQYPSDPKNTIIANNTFDLNGYSAIGKGFVYAFQASAQGDFPAPVGNTLNFSGKDTGISGNDDFNQLVRDLNIVNGL